MGVGVTGAVGSAAVVAAVAARPSLVGVASLLDEISVSLVAELSLFLPS